jgi:hypothetical protein
MTVMNALYTHNAIDVKIDWNGWNEFEKAFVDVIDDQVIVCGVIGHDHQHTHTHTMSIWRIDD